MRSCSATKLNRIGRHSIEKRCMLDKASGAAYPGNEIESVEKARHGSERVEKQHTDRIGSYRVEKQHADRIGSDRIVRGSETDIERLGSNQRVPYSLDRIERGLSYFSPHSRSLAFFGWIAHMYVCMRMGCAPLNMVVVLAAALAVLAVSGAPQSHLVEELPGQEGGVDFRQYAGYITVDASAGRALFYYFVTTPDSAQNNHNHEKITDTLNHHHHHHHHSGSDPHTPLALWLNGGPGCSSIGGGAFTELGPFFPRSDGRGLIVNKYAWNKVSNIIFLESPAGVGWSYSNSTHDYLSSGDGPTAKDTLSFLVEWFKLYPEYRHRPFYIIGESYAGHYIPQLASLLVSYKGKDGFEFNLKGIAIGNPLLRLSVDLLSTYTYLWSHGIIPDVVYNDIQKLCGFENFVLNIGHNNVSNNCYKLLNLADNEIGNYINNYDVLLDVCYPALIEQELRLRKKIAQISEGVDVCITSERNFYLNLPEVQKALHANVTALPYQWSVCSSLLNYSSEDPQIDMLPILKFLHDQGLRILIFSGDQDSVVPLIGTRTIIGELARELHLPTSIPYSAWYENHQVAGWAISYGENLTFATVRGAAHMVPYAQPARALVMFKSFINAQRLPSREH